MSNTIDLNNLVDDEALEAYLTAEYGDKFCVWENGTWSIADVSAAWRRGDGPVACVTSPGPGNLDMGFLTGDFCHWDDGKEAWIEDSTDRIVGSLTDVIHEDIRDGDMSSFRDDLIKKLQQDTDDSDGSYEYEG